MEVEKNGSVKITVFGHRGKETCSPGGCGPARSLAETTRISQYYLQAQYGEAGE